EAPDRRPARHVHPPPQGAARRHRRDHPGRGPVTRVFGRVAAILTPPNGPSIPATAALAVFAVVGFPPLVAPSVGWPAADDPTAAADRAIDSEAKTFMIPV